MMVGRQELGAGWEAMLDWDDYAESPRSLPNLSHMHAWGRRVESPDPTDCACLEDFLCRRLEEAYGTEELKAEVAAGAFASLRYRADGTGEARLEERRRDGTWYRADDWDWFDEDSDLPAACAEQPEAASLLAERAWLAPLYRLEHSGVAYSTSDFRDPWDSGPVGVLWCAREEADAFFGRPAEAEEVMARFAAEAEEYSAWANSEVYRLTLGNDALGVEETIGGLYTNEDVEWALGELKAMVGLGLVA